MNSKTPAFDAALDTILRELKPHDRTCKTCGAAFRIFAEDIEMYKMLRVPAPTLCPLCRKKRRFAHLMRVPKFFKKPCAAPGHVEQVVTVYPHASPHKVYDFSYWHSDAWDANAYGRDHDFTRPFFAQFRELFFDVPHACLERDPHGTGVEYTVGGMGGKNNYYSSMAYRTENALYCLDARFSQDLADCTNVAWSQLCYECVSGGRNYNSIFLADGVVECVDSAFLFQCRNSTHCFMSANLRNASYVFRGRRLSKEDYQQAMRGIDFGSRRTLEACKREFRELIAQSLREAVKTYGCRKSVGNAIMDCNDCYFVFRSKGAEHVRFADNIEDGVAWSSDVTNSTKSERIYEVVVNLGSFNKFCMYVRHATFNEYCSECVGCTNCFGCVGLKNKEFHIFNKPYRESNYWELIDRIKTKMLADGEYGEFFPLSAGLVPYQSSNAQKEFPITPGEASARGIPWYEEPEPKIPEGARIRTPEEVPDNIADVTDDILDNIILCGVTGKLFRLVQQELDFYRRMRLPIPTKHPWQRLMERSEFEQPVWLYDFTCRKCGEKSYAVYPPEKQKKFTVYCESCYRGEVV